MNLKPLGLILVGAVAGGALMGNMLTSSVKEVAPKSILPKVQEPLTLEQVMCKSASVGYDRFQQECGMPFTCRLARGGNSQSDCATKQAIYNTCRNQMAMERDFLLSKCTSIGGK